MALGDAYERRDFSSNAVATTLNGTMGGTGAVSPVLSAVTGWPSGSNGPFYVLFADTEIVLVTSRSASTLTVAAGGRGPAGTSAANHASGSAAILIGTSRDLDEANRMVNILGNATSGLPIVGAGAGSPPTATALSATGLASNAVTTAKILDANVTLAKLATDSVNADKIVADAVGTSEIAADAVGTSELAPDSVTATELNEPELEAIAGLTSASDRLPYFTGSGTASLATFTAAGRAIVDDADATAQKVTLGLVIGTNVQAYDADLAAIAGLTSAANKVIRFTGSGTAELLDVPDDLLGRRVGVSASRAATQSISTGTETNISFDQEDFDSDGGFAATSTSITAVNAGMYMCSITGYFGVAATTVQYGLTVGGSTHWSTELDDAAGLTVIHYTWLEEFTASQVINFKILHGTGSSRNWQGNVHVVRICPSVNT